MKNIFILLLLASSSAYAGPQFTCTTNAQEGYYVKGRMDIEVKDTQLFARPFDVGTDEWLDGSTGSLSAQKADGTQVFKGFKSEDMFGDLSEGVANKGIYIYVSADVIKGQNGKVSLAARGSETGLESATYNCVKK